MPQLSQVNRICDAFDSIWQLGQRDRSKTFLSEALADSTEDIARALLRVDVENRLTNGEQPIASDYRLYGPNIKAIAAELIREAALSVVVRREFEEDISTSTKGQYELLSLLGGGGMGNVWLARQHFPIKRLVAIKVLRDDICTDDSESRFLAERQLLAILNHPNIAKIHDGGTTLEGRLYLVMEYIEGQSISSYCQTHKLSTRAIIEVVIQVCRALEYAHESGLIHRDIKPANVLVSDHNGQPLPMLIDFGLAKSFRDMQEFGLKTIVDAGKFVGTINYMSPEQTGVNDVPVDHRSDIYSIGALLYALLTGSTPLQAKEISQQDLIKNLQSICSSETDLPSQRASAASDPFRGRRNDLRGDLDSVIMKSLEKDPGQRYQTISDFADDLENYLNQSPISARKPTVVYVASKFFRRYRFLSFAAAGCLIAFAAAGTYALDSYRKITEAETNVSHTNAAKLLNDVRLTQQVHATEVVKKDLEFAKYRERIVEAYLNLKNGDLESVNLQLAESDPGSRDWEYCFLLRKAKKIKSEVTAEVRQEFSNAVRKRPSEREASNILARSRNQRFIAVCEGDQCRIIDDDSNQQIQEFQLGDQVVAAAFKSNGKGVYAVTKSRQLFLLDRGSSEPFPIGILPVLPKDIVLSVSDKRILGFAGTDVYLFDASTGLKILKLSDHSEPIIRMVQLANDSLVTVDVSGAMRRWDGSPLEQQNLDGRPLGRNLDGSPPSPNQPK